MADIALPTRSRRAFVLRHPSVLIFIACLALFTLAVTVLSEGFGIGVISTSFVKTLGKTLCLCLVALAMDLVWGYCGILSLGHLAFFGLGGYAIGMWLMYARTEIIVAGLARECRTSRRRPQEIRDAIASQIFGVVGGSEFPPIWAFAAFAAPATCSLVVLVPGLLALVFGWLAFRSRVTGVYLSILTQAMTLALSLYLFQNDSGLRGNNGLSGLQNLPGLGDVPQSMRLDVVLLGLGTGARRWATCSAPGSSRASSARSSAASATTRRGCASSATRSRATSCSSSR